MKKELVSEIKFQENVLDHKILKRIKTIKYVYVIVNFVLWFYSKYHFVITIISKLYQPWSTISLKIT